MSYFPPFWGSHDYYAKYPRFYEVWNPDTKEAMFAGTSYPEWFQEYIFDYFYYRRICTEDIQKFIRFMNRNLKFDEWQFLEYVRVQTTEFDPMVTQYIERWIRSSNAGKRLTDNMSTLGSTTNYSGTTENKGTQTSTGTNESTFNTSRNSTGSNNTETDSVSSTTSSHTTDTTQNTAGNVTGHTEQETDTKTLNADLPQTSAYGEEGMPPNLNFSYASSQSESLGTSVTDDTSDTTSKQDTVSSTDGEETTRNNGTSNTETSDKTTGVDTTNGKTAEDLSRSEQGKNDYTSTTSGDNVAKTSEDSENKTDVKDWSTGRSGSPQDLLNSARNYILKTNATRWMLDHLEICFLGIYD